MYIDVEARHVHLESLEHIIIVRNITDILIKFE